jgi:putative SOS response-associated peptidase YedK
MCYSALVKAGHKRYLRQYGARARLDEYRRLYVERAAGGKVRMPRAMDDDFAAPQSDLEREIKALIDRIAAAEASRLEQEVFAQRKRLADAERKLSARVTKAATESRRVASSKVERAMERLADLRRTEPQERDSRIFPGYYAPVMVMEAGQLVVRPMRYQCRLAGKPAFYDTKFPGTYNARRDSLGGFWKPLFGKRHGILVASSFFENVHRHRVEGRELAEGEAVENVVLQFEPQDGREMLLACLWDEWSGGPGEPDLCSFAAITDEPPAEVAAAGHDRCVIPIDPGLVEAWLNPEGRTKEALFAILDQRVRPHYEHRTAA